jgi:opacity protein-like surface antigen
MRKLPALLAVAGLAMTAAPVLAQEGDTTSSKSSGAYVTVGVGGGWASSPSINYSESGSYGGTAYSGTLTGTSGLGGGLALDAGLGYDFGKNIRGEVTYVLGSYAVGTTSYSGNVTAGSTRYGYNGTVRPSGNLSTNSVMFSGYYDFKSKSKFTPYVGGGIGWTSVSIPSMPASVTVNGSTYDGTVYSGSASAFGYQAKIGVSYAVSKPADIFAEAIYQGNTGFTINSLDYGPLNAISVRAGARLRFGR